MSDYIYFVEAENGLVKIGRTINLERRMQDLENISPIPLRLLIAVNCDGKASKVEVAIHNKFGTQRHHGEWFELSEEQKQWIKRAKKKIIRWATWRQCEECDRYYRNHKTLWIHQKRKHGEATNWADWFMARIKNDKGRFA